MNLQALIAALQSLVTIAGDVPVIVHDLESGAETVLKSIGIHIGASSGAPSGNITLEHGTPAPAPPAPPSVPPPPPAG